MSDRGETVSIVCDCGQALFIYYKDKHGPLIKCYVDAIIDNVAKITDLMLGATPSCPACKKVLGKVDIIHERVALSINPEVVKLFSSGETL